MELGIPVVIAINMCDIIRKNGDKINTRELARELGCPVYEISALKGENVMEAAEGAILAAKTGKTLPLHIFSGAVEHALAHIEEAAIHNLQESEQRWYAIKIFERDSKILSKLNIDKKILDHIEEDIQNAEKELDDDAESIITNERYVYIADLMKGCYKKKAVGLSTSDKIDRIVTNRFLALPIFALVMWLVYFVSVTTVGTMATDWVNDGVFGDGFYLLGIGRDSYEEAAETFSDAEAVASAFGKLKGIDEEEINAETLSALLAETKESETASYLVVDEETLEEEVKTATHSELVEVASVLEAYDYEEPEAADYGPWVPGIPVLLEQGLEKIGCADWLSGLILDGIVAGVGAVLGFVPQMLVLFIFLAFLEACGYMARIA
ncbi:MAG: ferrous iron transporter B, partial [Spirochaetales bacterium]|nr:ferrous iron transporter B [Candidatus Physcosoma equi]